MADSANPLSPFARTYILDGQGPFTVRDPIGNSSSLYDVSDNSSDNLSIFGDIVNDRLLNNTYGNNFYYFGETSTKDGVIVRLDSPTSNNFLLFTNSTYTRGQSLPYDQQPFALCFITGTQIRTARGAVAVDALAVGDLAVTASGAMRSITWIGHRHLGEQGRALPYNQQPIRIRAGAFGSGLPERDLRLSPGHPVLVGADADGQGGHLVPIMCLINGTTIAREPATAVTYWHVELDAHDILLAEGLPAESYFDMGSRAWFSGEDGALIDPEFVPAGEHGRCRPVAIDGPVVEAERLRIDGVFAAELAAHGTWNDADVWLAA